MFEFAERIDHRDARVLRHSRYGRMSKCAQHQAIDPALEVVSDVAEFLARVDARGCLVDKEGMSAEAGDTGLKGEARPQRAVGER